MIKMVVFDMAGTTVDENNVVYKTLRSVINAHGYNFSLEQVLELGAGKEKLKAIQDIIASAAHATGEVSYNEIYNSFVKELALAYDSFDLKPQPGAEALFTILHSMQVRVVLNTGYNKKTAQSILQKLNWQTGQQIDGLITANDVINNRPQPDMILLAMEQFGITNAAEVAKVGDSAIDIEEGKNAGCGLCIGITTGANTIKQLQAANPDYIIDTLTDLLPLL